jgi:VWFA-related protein
MSTQDAPATFKSKVNLVLVPVVVRDRAGKPVGTLRQEDFALFDKGKQQVITKFSVEKAGRNGSVTAIPAVDGVPAGQPATDAGLVTAPEHFAAYLFDDIHASFGDLVQARDAAWRHLTASMKAVDRAAIYTTSGQTMLDFTDDRDKMHETLLRLRPRPIARSAVQECPDISYYMADLIQNKNDPMALAAATQDTVACANVDASTARSMAQAKASQVLSSGEQETRVAFSVLKDVVRRMTAMPGERIVVLVSPGFIRLNDQLQDETDIIDRAIRGNVTVSAIDARGLYTDTPDISKRTFSAAAERIKQQYDREASRASADVLAELADGTGGTFVQNTNDLDRGFREVSATPEFYYVLGFSPQNLKLDGSYHALKVSLKTPNGLNAKARRGYYAPRHLSDADEEAKEEITQALFSRDEMRDIPVELHTQFFKPNEMEARLVVLARLDVRKLRFRKLDGRNRDDLVVVSGLFDRNGNYLQGMTKKIEMRLKDETLETKLNSGVTVRSDFKVAPGTYVIRLVVRDAEGQMMAAQNGAVEIP